MYSSPRKERQDKYQRLLNLIHTFKHTKQQLKLLNKIKSDTVFEITLRHKRCQANKKYKFPFNQDQIDDQDDYISELMGRPDGKDLVYDLSSQNNRNQLMRINIPIAVTKTHRQKVMTEPAEREKAKSLSKPQKRVLIGRLDNNEILSKNKFHQTYTYRMPTQSTLATQKHSTKQLSTPRKVSGSKSHRTTSYKMKTEESTPKKPIKLLEFQTLTLKKLANRLRTERSNEKKSKIETFVSKQLKRQAQQDHLIKCASSALKIKPKNILHKGYY